MLKLLAFVLPLGLDSFAIAAALGTAALPAVGAWMLLAKEEGEAGKAQQLLSKRGIAVITLGLAISTDELAIGFSLGLTRLPVAAVILAIAIQALIASQLGLALGGRIGERWREAAERLAGLALSALGIYLTIDKALH